jgi:hypothetical protein
VAATSPSVVSSWALESPLVEGMEPSSAAEMEASLVEEMEASSV